MSLHKFAEQVAQHGRGDDSLLVHMTPDEVRKLQQFAEANGTTLTINPHTGLPEAGLLSDFFKMVAPVALGAFLGPAGVAFGGPGLSAAMAGVATGGITALATGSLSRGLMAGLGAYGGAGLGAGLETAGLQAEVAAGLPTVPTEGLAQADIPNYVKNVEAARGAAIDKFGGMSMGDKFSAGLGAIKEAPMDFLSKNAIPLAAAAAPIMAGAMVPTTTSMPTSGNTGFIRQKIVNPDGTVRDLTPVKASEWGSRNFSDVYRGYNGGGIVALAGGGGLDTNSDIYKYFADPATQALLSSGNDAAIAAKMQEKDWTPAQIAAATGTQGQLADYERRFVKAVDTPTTDANEFLAATKDVGLQGQSLANALQGSGMSQAAQYASTHGLSDVGGIGGTTNGITDPNNFYNKLGYTPGALPGDQGGLEGLYANINYAAKGLQNQIAAGNMTGQQAREAALTEMNRVRMSEADLKAATGKTLAELFPDTKTKLPVTTAGSVVPGDTKLDNATSYYNGAFGNYGSGPATGVDYLGRTVSIATPGDIITNPDQTRTVTPNIPGRPYGGFTGMDQVKSAYTAGGGSLGYTSKAPRTIAEFDQLYNKQTGDSLAAYDYLMGKGAGKYPTKSGVGEIARPYAEATLGYPASTNKMYNWDPVAGKMVRNFDYVAPGRDDKGNVTYGMSLNDIKKTLAAKPLEGQALYDWAKTNNLSADDIAAATGRTLSSVYADFRAGSKAAADAKANSAETAAATGKYDLTNQDVQPPEDSNGPYTWDTATKKWVQYGRYAGGGMAYAMGGGLGSLGAYSDGGRLLKGPGDGVSDSIPATIGAKQQPARLADGEFVIPARIVSELGNGSTDAGAKKLYAMMDRVQKARSKTTGKNKVAANSRADKYLPA